MNATFGQIGDLGMVMRSTSKSAREGVETSETNGECRSSQGRRGVLALPELLDRAEIPSPPDCGLYYEGR